jgi:tRNA(Ile2) C34 agmatinyltransferase TiaS
MSVKDTKIKIYYECPDCGGTNWIKKGASTSRCRSCKDGIDSKLISLNTLRVMMTAAAVEDSKEDK